jgi:hypothetical protein
MSAADSLACAFAFLVVVGGLGGITAIGILIDSYVRERRDRE